MEERIWLTMHSCTPVLGRWPPRLRESLQLIDAGNPHVLNTTLFQISKNRQPEFGALIFRGVKTQHILFTFDYDKLNRLKSGVSTGVNMSEYLSYDVMGNIASLNRDGTGISTYKYTGNRLEQVETGPLTTGLYEYDRNGNAKIDGRNGVTIGYNLLNLPSTVRKPGVLSMNYTYDARGSKLKKVSNMEATSDYVDGIQYTGGAIEFIMTEEGKARRNPGSPGNPDTYSYEYNLTDHLGNVRTTFYRNPNTQQIEVLQRDDYYAFGLRKMGSPNSNTNKYLYNGKELQEELGQYDYGFRFYDPVIGRWNVVDPLSEKMRRHSPYNYAFNNPIRFVDPDGMAPDDWIKWSDNDGRKFITYDSGIKSVDEAKTKGYTNVEKVFESGIGNSTTTQEEFAFEKGGLYSVNGGDLQSVKNGTFRAENGITIDGNLSYTQQTAAVFSGIGDFTGIGAAAATATGIGAPVGGILGAISSISGGIGTLLDLSDDAFNSGTLTAEKSVTKVTTTFIAPGVLKRTGLNDVQRSIIDMQLMGLDKTLDRGRDNLIGPYRPK